ncbi:Fic family protein [Arthrobacter sp. Br18]|uniref:type II toxin-antitoxin system death-on-curing family toxin n=1 Tax=Arthrobacter sp. Br18 TaxID=1312954 RepID=UPI00047B429D|nr:Fic family protein [Arthrobacter sp. Br18]
MTAYLELEDALYIIDDFGFHIRDVGLLHSALARPATTVAGSEAYPDLPMKAAALLESGTRNHALIDDNKRTAWALMVVFLGLNGYRHNFPADAAFDLVVGVASSRIGLGQSSHLIKKHLVSRTP